MNNNTFGSLRAVLLTASLLGAPTVAGQRPAARVELLGTVTIEVVDGSGLAVPFKVQSFLDKRVGREMVSNFDGLHGAAIPYGTYDYLLQGAAPSNLGSELPGRVEVKWPETLVILNSSWFTSRSANDMSDRGFIHGRIESLPRFEPPVATTWIRLSSLYGSDSLEVAVDAAGDFRIYKRLVGRYLLTVVRGEQVLDMEQVWFDDVSRHELLLLKLPDKPPPVIEVHGRR